MTLANTDSARVRSLFERALDLARGSGEHAGAQRGAMLAFAIRVASAAIAYLSQVLLARMMGTFEFGIFAYVWVWVIILGTFVTLGLNTSVLRFVPEYMEARSFELARGFVRAGTAIPMAAGMAVAIGGGAATLALAGEIATYYVLPLVLGFACLPAFALSDSMDGLARSRGWIHLALAPPYIARPVLILMAMVAAIAAGAPASALTAAGAAVAATWAVALGQTLLVRRRLRPQVPSGPHRYALATWIAVSIPVVMMDGFYLVMAHADIMIMNLFVAPDQIAIYYAAVKTTSLIAFVFFSVTASYGARFADYTGPERRDELRILLAQAINWTFWPSLVAAAGILALGLPLLWLFGPEFTAGYPVMFILVIGLLARAATGPAETMMIINGHQNAIAAILCVAMAVNMVLNFTLIPRYGLMGAALATSVSMVLVAGLQVLATRRRMGLHAFVIGGGR